MRYFFALVSFVTACSDGHPRCTEGTVLVGNDCVPVVVDLAENAPPDFAMHYEFDFAGSPPDMAMGKPAQCSGTSNVVYFDGDDYIYSGMETITQGMWTGQSMTGTAPTYVHIGVTPTQSSQGLWWDLEFSSQMLGAPLSLMPYYGAMRAAFTDPGHPGLEVTGNGSGCNMISGEFTIYELTMSGTNVSAFTAGFEQTCDGGPGSLKGCVHYQM